MTNTNSDSFIARAETPKAIKALIAHVRLRSRKVKNPDRASAMALVWLLHAAADLAEQMGKCPYCFVDLARAVALGLEETERTPTHNHSDTAASPRMGRRLGTNIDRS